LRHAAAMCSPEARRACRLEPHVMASANGGEPTFYDRHIALGAAVATGLVGGRWQQQVPSDIERTSARDRSGWIAREVRGDVVLEALVAALLVVVLVCIYALSEEQGEDDV
jgi:hypothetical protein